MLQEYDTEEIAVVERYRRSKWIKFVKFLKRLFRRKKRVYKCHITPPPVKPIVLPQTCIDMHEEMERRRATRNLNRQPQTEAIRLSEMKTYRLEKRA